MTKNYNRYVTTRKVAQTMDVRSNMGTTPTKLGGSLSG